MESRSQLQSEVATLFSQAVRALGNRGPDPWLDLDLTLPQLKALLTLGARGPSRPSVIAAAIGVTPTQVTGILDRLERYDFVDRSIDPSDRRALIVSVLPAGEAILEAVYGSGITDEELSALTDEELSCLRVGMAAVVAHMESVTSDDSVVPA